MNKILIFLFMASTCFANPVTLLEENFENCPSFDFTIVAGSNDMDATRTWNCTNGYIEINGDGGGADEDWLVSPAIDMTIYGTERLSFWYRNAFEGQNISLLYSMDYNGDGTTTGLDAATWTEIDLDLYDIAINPHINNFLPYPAIDISDIQGTAVYFAFRYSATAEVAELWQLDKIRITADYYTDIENLIDNGLACSDLKTALAQLLRGHQNIFYSSSSFDVWDAFYATDRRLNDAGLETIVWDVYSDNPSGPEPYTFEFGVDQDMGSGGPVEGLFYNREHVFPKSWWGGGTSLNDTQYVDLHHIFPSDKQVNQLKASYSIGQTNIPNQTTQNGCKIGPNSNGSYTGTIFEPIEEYKGDFARTFLYMATRYQHRAMDWQTESSIGNAAMNGNSYTFFENWLLQMLLTWHENDPISERERHRNEAIFTVQQNRNPFIDHPEYVALIWGASDGTACGTPLPLANLTFDIFSKDKDVVLTWQKRLTDTGFYTIEHAWNGGSFEVLGQVSTTDNLVGHKQHYEFLHPSVEIGQHYYRLIWQDEYGTTKKSALQSLIIRPDGDDGIQAYFFEGQLWLKVDGRFLNVLGQ